MSSEEGLHVVRERGDIFPGDQEGGNVEQVDEDLVAVAECGAEVLVARGSPGTELLGTQLPLDQQDVVVCGRKEKERKKMPNRIKS